MSRQPKKRNKHIPIRTCIVTRKHKPKVELIRLVRMDDKVEIDIQGKKRGRGANISADIKIFDKAAKNHSIEKALKLERKLSAIEIKTLRKEFLEGIELKKFRKGNKPVVIKVKKDKFEKALEKKILNKSEMAPSSNG